MRVLFIYPNIGSGHSIHMQPGLASMSALLKRAGHQTALIDLTEPMDPDDFKAQVRAFSADMVAFSIVTNQWRTASQYAGYVRDISKTPIVCGGYHPTLVPEQVVENPNFNWVIRGEGEEPLFDLVEALDHDRSPDGIANVWGGPNKVKNPLRPPIPNLDVLPLLDWDIFDNDAILPKCGCVVELCLGRGCPMSCTYCCNPQWNELYRGKGKVVRKFSVPRAIAELKVAADKFKPKGFFFYDEVFTVYKEWVREFCDQYKREIDLPFQVQFRVDLVDDEIMEMLKYAGCAGILAGVEVGNEAYRRQYLNRNMSNDVIRKVFRKADELGIATFSFVMFGLPKETPRLIRETIRFAKELHPDHIQSTIYYPFPKTPLAELAEQAGFMSGQELPSAMTDMSILRQPRISPKLLRKSMYRVRRMSLRYMIDKQETGIFDFTTNFKHARRQAPIREFIQLTIFGEYPGEVVVLAEHPPSKCTYALVIPENAVLRTAVGLNPEVWNKRQGDAVRFSVVISDAGTTQELIAKTINPKYIEEDQGWHPIEIPLQNWAGKKVKLSFITQADPSDNTFSWAGWARPHIARATDPEPWYFVYTGRIKNVEC